MKRIRKGLGSRSPWITCSAAVLLTAAALALTLQTPLRDGHPFLLFLAAVYLTTRFSGLGPGLVAGLLGVFATAYFFLPPFDSFFVENVADVVGLAVFALVALVLAWLTASRERAGDCVATQARRQAALAELQSDALASLDRTALLDRAAALLHPLFDVEYAGIFQALPDGASLILKAGSGWRSGMVGRVRIGSDTDSFVRGALNSREPLIFRDLRLERTFNVPRVFADHNVVSGVTVVVPAVADQDHAQPFGVIGLYTTRRRNWANGDVEFVQTFAHTLANALDHVRGDARVKAQREWLQVTLASIGDGVIATDPQGHVAFINPVAQSLTGWNETEALSRPLDQILTIAGEKTGQVMENPGIKALVSRSVVPTGGLDDEQGSAVLVTRTGDRTPVDGIAAPMFDDQGRSLGSVLILRDISVRRRNEQALVLGAERFRVALLNSPVVVFNQDADLRYTWIPNITRGFPPPSALGKTDAEWMPPAEAIRWTEIKRGVLESGLGTREELAATVHGERRTFDLTVEPLRDGGGSVAGVTCTCIDITERKREQATTARLAAIVESSEEAITGATLDGIILSWNPGAERLYGYAPDEIIGRPHSVLHPPGWQDEVRAVAERLKQGEPMEHRQAVRIRKDGSPVDVSVTMSLVRDSMGRIIGISSIARDITERKRMEDVQRFRTAASDLLSSSLDYEGTLAAVAQIAVPRIADWCAIHLVADDGTIRQVALAHEDPAQVQRVRERLSRFPPDPQASQGVPNVIRTGRPELLEQVTAERLAALASGPEHLQFLVDLGLQSLMIVPLTVRRQTFGALSFACTTSGRRLTPEDMALAQDLANRAALWGDNARLFRELQKANEELEQRVIRRTVELQGANQQLQAEIAERRRTTEQLHQLSAHLQSAREEERISVAREIHDELGQILTAVRMDLDILERDLSQPDRRNGEGDMLVDIRATMRLVDDSIQKMHEIIHELRPEILDHLGLGAAIEWQAQEFQTRSGIECRITSAAPDLPLDRDRSTAVFRILQEALTNVARHAQAKRVDIQLRIQDREFVLEVRDDGRGIAGGELTRSKSFGILGMRERALVFGGHVDLFSEPGKGTAVVAHIPMEELHDSNLDRG